MLILNSNEKVMLKRHFSEQGIPLTMENLEKYTRNGVLKSIMIESAQKEGMTPEQAQQFYANFAAKVAPDAVAEAPIEGDLLSDEVKDEVTAGAENERTQQGQLDQLGTIERQDKKPSALSFDVKEEELPGTAPVDTGFTDDQLMKSIEAVVETPPADTVQTGPVGEQSAEEPMDLDADIEAIKADISKENPYIPEDELNSQAAARAASKDTPPGKSTENYNNSTGSLSIADRVNAASQGLADDANLKNLLPGGAVPTGMVIDDKVTGDSADLAVTRPRAIDALNDPNATLGSSPAQSDVQGSGAAITPKQQKFAIAPPPDVNKLTPADSMAATLAMDKLMRSNPGKPKLKPDGSPVIGSDGRPVMVGKVELDLSPTDVAALIKYIVPAMGGGSSHVGTVSDAKEWFKSIKADPELLKRFTTLNDLLVRRALSEDTEEDIADKENLEGEIFGKKIEQAEAKKDYQLGMSSIDRKRMMDYIVKGLGQVAAGVVGNWQGADVGGSFKYDLTDFSPQEKQVAQIYSSRLKDLSDEVQSLEKMMYSPEKKKAKADQLEKLLGHTANLIKGLTDSYGQGTKQKDTYAGLYGQIQYLTDLLMKYKLAEMDASNPRGTNISMQGGSLKQESTTSTGSEAGARQQLNDFQMMKVSTLNNSEPEFLEIFNKFKDPVRRENALVQLFKGTGSPDPQGLYNIYEEWLNNPANAEMPPDQAFQKIKVWNERMHRGLSASQTWKQSEDNKFTETNTAKIKGAVPKLEPKGRASVDSAGPKSPVPNPTPPAAPSATPAPKSFEQRDSESAAAPKPSDIPSGTKIEIDYGGKPATFMYNKNTDKVMVQGRGVSFIVGREDPRYSEMIRLAQKAMKR